MGIPPPPPDSGRKFLCLKGLGDKIRRKVLSAKELSPRVLSGKDLGTLFPCETSLPLRAGDCLPCLVWLRREIICESARQALSLS